MIDKILLELEAQEIKKELRRERRDTLRSLRASMRKQYCKELWLETNPLPRLMKKYLRQNGYSKLISLCENVAEQVAREQYAKPVSSEYEMKRLDKKLKPLIGWLKENSTPDRTFRNARLFKNLAIYWFLCGLPEEQIRDEARQILSKTSDKSYTEVMGWVAWARRQTERGKRIDVNVEELRKWISDANQEVRNG